MHLEGIAKLASSCLSPHDAIQLGIAAFTASQTEKLTGVKRTALNFAYHDHDGKLLPHLWRVRFLGPSPVGAFGEPLNTERYRQSSTTPDAYYPRTLDWNAIAADTERAIVITEGELKAACAAKHGFACIGLGGVWMFRHKQTRLIPSLEAINWTKRHVLIAFDSEINDGSRPDLLPAQITLANALRKRGALVHIVAIPPNPPHKVGLDDYVLAHRADDSLDAGAACLRTLFDSSPQADEQSLSRQLMNLKYAYISGNDAIYNEEARALHTVHGVRNDWIGDTIDIIAVRGSGNRAQQVTKPVNVFEDWFRAGRETRRTYTRLTYQPGAAREVAGELNTWRGFASSPMRGDIGPWNELLTRIFKSDPPAREWFERWLAWPIQHPTIRQMTAACIWASTQGIGKSRIGHAVGRIYGENYAEVGQKELESDFNALVVNKHFVMFDEMSKHDSRSKADALKKMITEERMIVRMKYISEYSVPACAHYYLTSNDAAVLYLANAQERRYFIHHAAEEKPGQPFFDKLGAWIDSAEGISALHHHLLHLPLGDFSPHAAAPCTQSKLDMAEASESELTAWVRALPDNAPRDLYAPHELASWFNRGATRPLSPTAVGLELRVQQFPQLARMKIGDTVERLWCVRHYDRWKRASNAQIVKYMQEERAK